MTNLYWILIGNPNPFDAKCTVMALRDLYDFRIQWRSHGVARAPQPQSGQAMGFAEIRGENFSGGKGVCHAPDCQELT